MRIESSDGAAVPRGRRNSIGAAIRNALGGHLGAPDRAVESGAGRVQIRPFGFNSDLPACVEIYYRSRRETFTWLHRSRFRRSDFLVDTFEEELFVAEQEGEVIAFAGVYPPDDFLHHLYVAREYQGRGIGSALLQHLLNRSEGRLRLKCLRRNKRALAFYRKRGWREGERGRDGFGEWVTLHGPAPGAPP